MPAECKNADDYLKGLEPGEMVFKNSFRFNENNPSPIEGSHDYIRLVYITDGRVYVTFNDVVIDAASNEIIFCPPFGKFHGFSNRKARYDAISIGIKHEKKENGKKLAGPFKVTDYEGNIRWLFEQVNYYSNRHIQYREIINTYLQSILLLMKRNYYDHPTNNGDIVETVLRYIEDHFDEELTVEKLASLVYVSPSYLSRLFNKKLGISPMRYVNKTRIKAAKRLITLGSYSIEQISDMIGFNNPKYFSRVFKKAIGESPMQYRNNINEYV